jgi:hypothetical protein
MMVGSTVSACLSHWLGGPFLLAGAFVPKLKVPLSANKGPCPCAGKGGLVGCVTVQDATSKQPNSERPTNRDRRLTIAASAPTRAQQQPGNWEPLLRQTHRRRCLAPHTASQHMASTLRRRGPPAVKEDESASEPSTSREDSPVKGGDRVKVVHHRPKQRKRKTTAIFLLGSLFGLVAAGFFAKSNDLIGFPEIGELSMDSLFDVLPAGLVKDMRELVVSRRRSASRASPRFSID